MIIFMRGHMLDLFNLLVLLAESLGGRTGTCGPDRADEHVVALQLLTLRFLGKGSKDILNESSQGVAETVAIPGSRTSADRV